MTPYELEILLHYYWHATDHPDMTNPTPLWRETIGKFLEQELLEQQADPCDALYTLTERGHVYMDAVLGVTLPERRWVMPEGQP